MCRACFFCYYHVIVNPSTLAWNKFVTLVVCTWHAMLFFQDFFEGEVSHSKSLCLKAQRMKNVEVVLLSPDLDNSV